MNIFGKIKDYIREHKGEQWFRYTVIIVSLTVIAVGANRWREWEDRKENARQETEVVQPEEKREGSFLEEILEKSKFHLFMFTGLTAALAAVSNLKSMEPEQTGRKEKK
ncbi:MAG: hypothetical protein NC120_06595 [Ruminococcus sp.]|nr:hypothetical protein [Ruminococcus sp.]